MEIPDLTTIAPYLQQISFGLIGGFIAGYALKKVGKVLAIALGILFICIQILAYFGFVTIDWFKIQESVDPLLEPESINRGWRTLVSVLTHNITFAASFIPGLILGIKRG